jgi:DNA polymerase III delta subunit
LEIIKYKSKNYTKIISELEKLFITYDFIDEKIIRENITPELDESIFVFIDNILSANIKLVLKNLEIILSNSNIYQFYN